MIAILALLSVIFPVGAWADEGKVHCGRGPLSGKILEYYNDLPKGEHQKLYRAAYEAMNLDPDHYTKFICGFLKPDDNARKPAVSVQIPYICTNKYVTKKPKWIIEHIQQNTGTYLDNEKRMRFCQEAQNTYKRVYGADDGQGLL